MRRRSVLAACATLGGCGFRPLYLPEGPRGSPASLELAAIYVPVIPERTGQLLRQALQRRVQGTGEDGIAKRYELVANMVATAEAIAIQRDSSATRVRINASGPWSLRTIGLKPTVLTQGSSRTLDGYNILNQQYFAADLESDTAYRRVAESLADQIVLQVAVFLKRRAAAA